jgi:HEAT repeat protein
MMIRASAALIGALLVGVVQAAQEPAAAPTIAAVRARVQAGELDRAWALIQTVPETGETLREGITIALARQDISGAVAWYERLSRREPAGDARLLGTIATVRARLLRTHEDPAVRVQACAALLPRTDEGCDKELRSWARDGALDFTTRLAAAAALVRAGKENSRPLLQDIVQSAPETSGAAVADALGGLPPGFATPVLIRLASSGDRDARYLAGMALSRETGPEVLGTLRMLAADETAGAARLAAYIGLARAGDKEAMQIVDGALPLMGGREALETARMLLARRDPRGPKVVLSVLEGDDELLRFDAAELLRATDRRRADAVILAGIASGNPWTRARALEAAANANLPANATIRRELANDNPWVAVRAAQAVLSSRPVEARAR